LLRDLLTEDYQAIRIDNATEHQRVVQLVERIMPSLAPKVKLYSKPFPIFDEYGVQAEIDKALKSKVWLKSGGSIVINQTEALVAIDVNTGRYIGKKSSGRLEDTIIRTYLEAVKEVGPDLNGHGLLLRVNPDIARVLKEEESAVVNDLMQTTGKNVTIKADAHLHHEQFDVMAV